MLPAEPPPETTTPDDSVVETPAAATTVDVAPTFTFAVATETPGTLTMRLLGVWQQPWLGGGGGGGGEHEEWQPPGGPATATPPAASAAALAAASMCRHETFITSLQTASPAGMQRAGPFLP